MNPNLEDIIIRALRSGLQAFVAALIGNGFLMTQDRANASTVLIGAGLAGLTAILSFAQNWLEKATHAPDRLRG